MNVKKTLLTCLVAATASTTLLSSNARAHGPVIPVKLESGRIVTYEIDLDDGDANGYALGTPAGPSSIPPPTNRRLASPRTTAGTDN